MLSFRDIEDLEYVEGGWILIELSIDGRLRINVQ